MIITFLTSLKRKIKPVKLLCTCGEVKMSVFVQCIVKGDYSGLISQGKPSNEQLNQAWEQLFNEYINLSGDLSVKKLLSLLKEIAILSNRLMLIEMIVSQLAVEHVPGLADQLRKLGFRFQYAEGENLMRELELTIAQSKTQLVQLNQAKAELEEMRSTDNKQATAQDFEMQISAIEEFKGVAIDIDTYTVARYCADVNRMKLRYKANQK